MINNKLILVILAILLGAGALIFFVSPPFNKSQEAQPKHVSMLVASDLQLAGVEGVKTGLKELGYKEGSDIVYELFNPKGDRELTKKMAEEIVSKKPDLIIALSTSASRAVKDANQEIKIPVVAVDVGNFAELGIENIQRPGGFMTGVVVDNVPAGAKRMEILKELLPNLKTAALLVNNKHISYNEIIETHEAGAKKLGIKLIWYPVTKKEEVTPAMEKLVKAKPDVFMTTSEAVISGNADLIAPVLKKVKIPSIDFNVERGVTSGYLMVYGIPRFETGKQGARMIDKVLKGQNPGDLPVEFASTITLEINNVLAQEMGLKVPDSLLLRANKVYR